MVSFLTGTEFVYFVVKIKSDGYKKMQQYGIDEHLRILNIHKAN